MSQRSRLRVSQADRPRGRSLTFESLEGRAMLSLTHHYTFNDGTANDSVGSLHGTLVNGASVIDQQLVLLNDGVSSGQDDTVQHVQLPTGILPESGSATIEIWYASYNASNWSRVFDLGSQVNGSGDSYFFFSHQSGSNDSRTVFRPSGGSERVATSGTTDDGGMTLATIFVDASTATFRLYIDGVEQGSDSLGRRTDVGAIEDTINYLGRSLFDGDPGFTGLIDEVRIYDEPLSAATIAEHAAAGPIVDVTPGDYDGDGAVGDSDLAVWKAAYGATGESPADGNGDGVVNSADYIVWRNNYGAGSSTPPDQVLDNDSLSVATLRNTVVEMTGRSELHLTGGRGVLNGSEIRLNSDDAWLFFENIKPSVVASSYLGSIRINGAAAIPGITARVVQHELGTVVIPHAATFQPFEAFTGPQFTGESLTFEQYVYHDTSRDLGVMYRNLSSFKLKRGYMATIATEADGGGTSKVYIAQDHDLEVSLLPEDLDNSAQFLRVFPWRYVSKKGASDIAPETLDAAWGYNWNNNLDSTLDWEYVPIKQQPYWPGDPAETALVTHWLGFNEPDNPVEDAYQNLGNGSVDAAIAFWPNMLRTGLRVGSPAVTDGGKAWLYEFMDKAIANNLRVDYIAIHNYQANHSAASLRSWLEDVYNRYQLPIWITEFNNGANWTGSTPPSNEANAAVIGSFIDMMDETPWIERYSIYSRVEAVRELTYSDGSLTPTGQVYHDNESPIGYQQELAAPEPTSGRSVAQLGFDGGTLDGAGYGYNGHLVGSPTYTAGVEGQALDLDGSTNFVRLPAGVASGDEFTFAGWVNWDGGGNWQRIFDFGNGTSSNLFLTPSNGSTMRFSINHNGVEQRVDTAPLTIGEWTHVAVTLGGGQAKLYVDGVLAATQTGVTLKPSDFNPTQNYLGDSQYASDPLFNGRLDDVLITDTALSQRQIAGLMNNATPAFGSETITLGDGAVGAPYSGTLAGAASDPHYGTTLTYAKAHGPVWLTVAADGTLSGAPTSGDLGAQEFVVTATNADGAVTYAVLSFDVVASSSTSSSAAMAAYSESSDPVETAKPATPPTAPAAAEEDDLLLLAALAESVTDDPADLAWLDAEDPDDGAAESELATDAALVGLGSF